MAENTNGKGNFNDYRQDLKVFEDLLFMSDEEMEKEKKSAQDILEMRNGKNKEKEELEAYFAELDQKEVITGIERLQRIEKEKRYNQILEAEMPKEAKERIEEAVTSDKFRSELERYAVFSKVRDPLSVAEKTIIDARKSKEAKLKVARRELKAAQEQDNRALFNINKKLEELDKYFEDFFKKEYTTEEEQKAFEEKRKLQKELLEAKGNIPSQAAIDARANVENIKRNAEEHEIIDIARQKIKFMTDRSNWNQILTMSKEELMDFVNGKEINKPEQGQPTAPAPEQTPTQNEKENQGGEGAEAKDDEKGQDKKEGAGKDKKETPVRTGGVPVVSGGNKESEEVVDEEEKEAEGEPEEESKDLTDQKRSLWERFKGLFTKRFVKNKEKKKVRKPKRQKMTRKTRKAESEKEKREKRYIENYIAINHKEPGEFGKLLAKYAPNFLPQVRNILDGTEAELRGNYRGTQAEELVAKVDEKRQELEKIEGKIVNEDEQGKTTYEGTQAQELAEKVAASRIIGENSWDRTSRYIEKMNVGQILENDYNLRTIDQYYEQKSNPVVRVDTDYRDDFSEEPKRVEAVIKGGMDEENQGYTILEKMQQLKRKQVEGTVTTEEVITKQNKAQEWRSEQKVRPEDMKEPGIATYGIKAEKQKGEKLDLRNIVNRANEAAKAKVAEARGEAPKSTGPEHGDGDR